MHYAILLISTLGGVGLWSALLVVVADARAR